MQTKTGTVVEIVSTTCIGYCVSVVVGQLWLYPAFGVTLTISTNMSLTLGFVGISLCIKFVMRRVFTHLRIFRTKRRR